MELEPGDARGWMELADTLQHLGREAESRADIRKACELGLPDACRLQK